MKSRIVGALWEKKKDGATYWSGILNDLHGNINIAVFPNNKKQAENQPDMNIVISFNKPKEVALPKTGRKKKEEVM
jgi:uncharacterized protein (DUF736 family)